MVPIPAPLHALLAHSYRGPEPPLSLRHHPNLLAPSGQIRRLWEAAAVALRDLTLRVPDLVEHGIPLPHQLLLHRAVQLQAGEGSVWAKSVGLSVFADGVGGAGEHRRNAVQRLLPHGHAGPGDHLHLVSAKQGRHRDFLVWDTLQGHVPALGAGRL